MPRDDLVQESEKRVILEMYDSKAHPIQIADVVKRSLPTIYRVIRQANRPTPLVREGVRLALTEAQKTQIRMFHRAKTPTAQIVQELGLEPRLVERFVKELNLIEDALAGLDLPLLKTKYHLSPARIERILSRYDIKRKTTWIYNPSNLSVL